MRRSRRSAALGCNHPRGPVRVGRGTPCDACDEGGGPELSDDLDSVFRAHWWPAVATVTRLVGDLEVAEDAVQEACAAAIVQWRTGGVPSNPGAGVGGAPRRKAPDLGRGGGGGPREEGGGGTVGAAPPPAPPERGASA